MVFDSSRRRVKEESWEDFHRCYHSDSFKYSSNNERLVQNLLMTGPLHSQRNMSSFHHSSSSTSSWFGALFSGGDADDNSIESSDSRGSGRSSRRLSRGSSSSLGSRSRRGSSMRVKKHKKKMPARSSAISA
eukprot:CAMPEP_0168737418 /NCGR_PEP_ID=MMETSP0724-20121128/10386_1 /TAXON_ID=265536 /ORGANISM="Amphiprora sp., Strain CCMP467" /LENGTH=131 /DNA_ID=CAMNT_0008784687 /DNA_START=113 /DNA_END=508 /DNA_ORIENTATION=+